MEGEIDGFGEVMSGHGDFCEPVVSSGTTLILEKARCSHMKTVIKPNFDISPDDIATTSSEANSVAYKFITIIWTDGGW